MRTSLNEINEIEMFLLQQLDVECALLFEARLLTNPVLSINTTIQRKIHLLVKAFHRKQLRHELLVIHHNLFSSADKAEFQKKVLHYFER